MLWTIITIIASFYVVDAVSDALLGWSPRRGVNAVLIAVASGYRRRRALNPTERERLLELEDREAQQKLDQSEEGR